MATIFSKKDVLEAQVAKAQAGIELEAARVKFDSVKVPEWNFCHHAVDPLHLDGCDICRVVFW